jgi:hypothetical protein
LQHWAGSTRLTNQLRYNREIIPSPLPKLHELIVWHSPSQSFTEGDHWIHSQGMRGEDSLSPFTIEKLLLPQLLNGNHWIGLVLKSGIHCGWICNLQYSDVLAPSFVCLSSC